MDCFDTGQATHLIFETDAKPVVFIVAGDEVPWTMAWPGECGAPEIFVRECSGVHTVYAVSATGEASSQEVNCSTTTGYGRPPWTTPTTSSSAGGCSVAPGPDDHDLSDTLTTVTLAVGLLGAFGFRRRRGN